MADLRPTDEQQAILDAALQGGPMTVEAAAGSGKTTTLKMLARQFPNRRGLYIAYNRAIKDDAQKSFPATVDCKTSHGMASRMRIRYQRRLNGPRVRAQEAARILGITRPLGLGKDIAPLAPQQLARIAVATVNRFCYTADDAPTRRHVPRLPGLEDPAVYTALGQGVMPYVERAWADIQDPNGRLRFEHDHYLKMWQLTRPVIDADYLLVDEAQDLNPVVQAIVGYQTDKQVILVGDRQQQLYAWRGAVDAMATFPGRRLSLTQSFRFGEDIADEANKWLTILGAGLRVRGFDKVKSTVGPIENPDAILCRTNAVAMARVMDALEKGRRAALVGGGGEIARFARAAADLQAGRPCDHPELIAFASWREVREYVEQDTSGSDLQVFVNLVEKYGPAELLSVADRLVDEQRADVVVSTGHKAKGREWNSVRIATDFSEPKDGNGDPNAIPRENAMLAYVAVTRAKLALDRAGLAWVDEYLPGAEAVPAAAPAVPVELPVIANTPEAPETPAFQCKCGFDVCGCDYYTCYRCKLTLRECRCPDEETADEAALAGTAA
jgi:hypothetical protein